MDLLKLAAGCLICAMFCGDCLGMKHKRRSYSCNGRLKTITLLSKNGEVEAVFHLDDKGCLPKGTFPEHRGGTRKRPLKTATLLSKNVEVEAVFHLDDKGCLPKGTFQKQAPIKSWLYVQGQNSQILSISGNQEHHTASNAKTSQQIQINENNTLEPQKEVNTANTSQEIQANENDTVAINGIDAYEELFSPSRYKSDNDDMLDFNNLYYFHDTMFQGNFPDYQFDFGDNIF